VTRQWRARMVAIWPLPPPTSSTRIPGRIPVASTSGGAISSDPGPQAARSATARKGFT
jgi:hypothetical protein